MRSSSGLSLVGQARSVRNQSWSIMFAADGFMFIFLLAVIGFSSFLFLGCVFSCNMNGRVFFLFGVELAIVFVDDVEGLVIDGFGIL